MVSIKLDSLLSKGGLCSSSPESSIYPAGVTLIFEAEVGSPSSNNESCKAGAMMIYRHKLVFSMGCTSTTHTGSTA